MAKVTLRSYNSEIEKLIDRGVTDEAIAHCRHILRTFPKHLETYRLLGKANLEAKQYPQATDIFQRVLMSVPDDFVAHVGMSIIADDQRRLDDSIWHMERAFETQPSNAAIQGELQRLYGRRDGMEPPKIRLTRGALAHMYVQGDLYVQAIAEIQSVLGEDANRTDMLDLLSLAYFRNGQKADASDICAKLISSNPYSLNANRILVEILPSTGLVESTQVYRQHVVELDPYAAFTSASLFQTHDVPENAVSLERLDYKGQPVELGANWSNAGIALGSGPSSNPATQPDWLKEGGAPEQISPSAAVTNLFDSLRTAPQAVSTPQPDSSPSLGSAPAPATSSTGEAIPEWMSAVGWGQSTGAFDESAASMEPSAGDASSLEKADLPDWIKSMAPPAQESAPAAPAMPPSGAKQDDTMDWLNRLGGEDAFAKINQPAEPAPVASAEDWLNEFNASPATPAKPAQQEEPENLDWLNNLGGSPAAAQPAASTNDVPDWLSALSADEPEPASALPVDDGWKSLSFTTDESQTPATQTAPSIGNLGTSAAEQDAAMLWLESLAAKGGASADELITDPNARTKDAPEWVEQAKTAGESAPSKETSPATPLSSIGDLGTSAAEQDAAMLWLESLAAKGGASADELITDPNARTQDAPEWVEQAKIVSETPAPSMDWSVDTGTFKFDDSENDKTGSWLRDLDAKDAQTSASLASVESAPLATESAPWSAPDAAEPVAASMGETSPVAEEDLPSWLRDMQSKESAPVSANDDLPGWLKGEADAVDAVPEPTRPADWTPIVPPEPAPKPVAKPAARPAPRKAEPKRLVPAPALDSAPRPRRTGMLPPLIDPVLAQARDQLAHAKVPDALLTYSGMIRKGRLLDEVTFDLKDALYRFPVEVSIWQALGDAYMRANRLQDALDAYTKAEELLR